KRPIVTLAGQEEVKSFLGGTDACHGLICTTNMYRGTERNCLHWQVSGRTPETPCVKKGSNIKMKKPPVAAFFSFWHHSMHRGRGWNTSFAGRRSGTQRREPSCSICSQITGRPDLIRGTIFALTA